MLKLDSITKTFSPGTARELRVLDNINLEVESGEFVILLGSNGSGKSTLLKIVSGELMPDTGNILLMNKDVTCLPAYARARYLFHVRQSRESNLAPNLTVLEAFMLTLSTGNMLLKPLIKRRWEDQVRLILHSLRPGLESRLHEQLWSLSGGEHQLITTLVAAEMVHVRGTSGNLLILDEPVAHLDPNSSNSVMAFTADLAQRYGLTILMVTHDIEIASQFGSRAIILKNSKIVFDSAADPSKKNDLRCLKELI